MSKDAVQKNVQKILGKELWTSEALCLELFEQEACLADQERTLEAWYEDFLTTSLADDTVHRTEVLVLKNSFRNLFRVLQQFTFQQREKQYFKAQA